MAVTGARIIGGENFETALIKAFQDVDERRY
jgi:hypothetical protein